MGDGAVDFDRPRVRIWLPYETVTTRVVWSVGAGLLVLLGRYLGAGERVTSFPDTYTAAEYFQRVVDGLPSSLVPATTFHSWEALFYLWAPFIVPVAVWPLCLVNWRSRRARLASAAVVFGCVGWLLAVSPRWAIEGPLSAVKLLFTGGTGEEYQEEGTPAFLALWLWFTAVILLGVIEREMWQPERRPFVCAYCGYDTAGLVRPRCPERGRWEADDERGSGSG